MGKANEVISMLGGKVNEDKVDDKEKKDKDVVPINEPEDDKNDKEDKGDDFSDLNPNDDDDKDKKEKDAVDYDAEIIKFFLANPNPPDSKVHDLADKLGIEHSDLESKIYGILTSYLEIGKHRSSPDDDFDKEQLDAGIAVEKEHTDDPAIAKEIAKDHLSEFPDYYKALKKMEDELKGKKDEEPKKDSDKEEDENDV